MASAEPLDIKTIYSVSGVRAKPVRIVATHSKSASTTSAVRITAGRASMARAPVIARPVLILGVLNALVGMTMLAITWWPVDHFICQKFVYKTPYLDIAALGPMFGMTPQQIAETTAGDPSLPATAAPTITGVTAQKVIGATGYGWLTLSTLAAYVLSLAAGTALGQWSGPEWRRYAVIIFIGVLLGLGVAGVDTWQEFQTSFPPDYLRWAMLIGGVACLLLGMAFARGTHGWSRVGAVLTILAALASVIGLFLGSLCGAIPPAQASLLFLLMVFAVHSLYGWLLWPFASRGSPSEPRP